MICYDTFKYIYYIYVFGFPGGSSFEVKNLPAGDLGSITGLGRSFGEGNDYPLQYSCLENPMVRGAWWAIVHGIVKTWKQLKRLITTW